MNQYDDMDITSWLQTEGRRLAGACTRNPGQQQAGQNATRGQRRVQVPSVNDAAPPPCSLSEALQRMKLEK